MSERITPTTLVRWGVLGFATVAFGWATWTSKTLVEHDRQIAKNQAYIEEINKKLDDISAMMRLLLKDRGL